MPELIQQQTPDYVGSILKGYEFAQKAKANQLTLLAAQQEMDINKAKFAQTQAENILLDEAPFVPIFYDENYRLEQLNVRNFPENAMNYMDLSVVYLVPYDKLSIK